jgi:hypothetical protein
MSIVRFSLASTRGHYLRGTNNVRSLALRKTENNLAQPVIYTFDTAVPLPERPQQLPVPTAMLDAQQIDLAWAHHGSGRG